jgi:hypothetical protein
MMSHLSIASVAAHLIEYGLLGIRMTMPPALLFGLGFRMKNRMTLAFMGALFLSLGVAILGITLDGIDSGSGLALSRNTLMVKRADQPVYFWVSTIAFGCISLFMAVAGVFCCWIACRPRPNSTVK